MSKDAQPTVCVVMPAYRSSGTLPRAVRSVLQQEYQPLVLGISVMRSDSETVDVAESISDPRVKVVYRTEPGISHARNSVIRSVPAPLYMFLDTDDAYYDCGVIGSLVNDYRSMPCPALRYGDWVELSPHSGAQRWKGIGEYGTRAFAALLRDNFIATGTVMVERETLERVRGFDEQYSHAEDWDLWLRIARHYPLRHVRRKVLLYTATKLKKLYSREFLMQETAIVRRHAQGWLRGLVPRLFVRGRYGIYYVRTLLQRRSRRSLGDVQLLDLAAAMPVTLMKLMRWSFIRRSAFNGA